jgi:hypothetical protein
MPLSANFLADFSSYLSATKASIAATEEFEQAAAGLGPAVDQSVGQAGATLDANAAKFEKLGHGIGVALASQELRNFAGDVQNFASTYLSEFAEAEAATGRLQAALVASGQASPAVAKAYGEMATELQRMSTFSDEAITDAQTMLTTVGNIKPDNMRETLKVTMDLAKGLGIDLVAASNLVAKAASSDGEALGKLKVILGDSVSEGADFAEVMEAINQKFGGQSAAAMGTTAGQMENLNNQMSDLNEQVGGVLAENLKSLLSVFQSMPEGVQTFTLAVIGIGTALAPVLVSLTSLVSLLSATGLGAGIVSAFTAILPFLGPAGLIVAGVIAAVAIWKNWESITGYVQGVYTAVKTWLLDRMTAIINSVTALPGRVSAAFRDMYTAVVGNSYVPDMVEGIKEHFGRIPSAMEPARESARHVSQGFRDMEETGRIAFHNLEAAFNKYEAATGGKSSVGMIGGGPAPDFISWAMGHGLAVRDAAGGGGGGFGGGHGGGFPGGAFGGLSPNITVNLTMSGMMGTDDPQTRQMVKDLISDALMQGMRGSRLMGTA